jgi:pectate lyase
VRFGDVDVYNNVYAVTKPEDFGYFLGVGRESSIYAQYNVFTLPAGVDPAGVVHYWGGTELHLSDSLLNTRPFDFLAAYNASAPPGQQLGGQARWTPTLRAHVDPVRDVEKVVRVWAGPGIRPGGGR